MPCSLLLLIQFLFIALAFLIRRPTPPHLQGRKRAFPFLIICEDLQSRIYTILRADGLKPIRNQFPAGYHAHEILYLFSRYFAWEAFWLWESEIGDDPQVIEYTREIRRALTSDAAGNVLCIYRTEQYTLANLAYARNDDFLVSFEEFVIRLEATSLHSRGIADFIEVFKPLEEVEQMDESLRIKLEFVQERVNALLSYLERKLRVKVSVYERLDAKKN